HSKLRGKKMQYISTRGKDINVSSSEAIIQGISKDGGLFVPKVFPKIANIEKLMGMDYKELAYEIMSKFITDFEPHILRDCIERAYDDKFIKEIVPIKDVDGTYFLELFHGQTLAFKDIALSILPHLLKAAMDIKGVDKEIVI